MLFVALGIDFGTEDRTSDRVGEAVAWLRRMMLEDPRGRRDRA
jgi:hypothetical protein